GPDFQAMDTQLNALPTLPVLARTSSDAGLGRPVRVTALRRADVFAFEPGPASRRHGPTPSVAPAKNHLGEMDHAHLLCATEQMAPSALPSRFRARGSKGERWK